MQPFVPRLMVLCSMCLHCHCFFVRPKVLSNGTVIAEIIDTDDRITTPGGPAKPEVDIDMSQFEFPLTENDTTYLSTLLKLPQKGEERLRKEYRVMTDEERAAFHDALNILKNDKTVSLNKYDLLANIHSRASVNRAAHGGPGFLGWHRVFLLMTENALRQAVPGVTIPYWDTTLDHGLIQPHKSVLWTPGFLGTSDGDVIQGPFSAWETPFGFGHLKRQIMAQGRLMNQYNIDEIMQKDKLWEISYFTANLSTNIEAVHNKVHVWVGGQMRKIEIGAFDPVFFLLHSFVDLLWESFRIRQRENGIDPEYDYPVHYGKSGHAPFAPMGLGSLFVIDGISNIWNKQISYGTRPSCNASYTDCGSPYLKCDSDKRICVSLTLQDGNQTLSTQNDHSAGHSLNNDPTITPTPPNKVDNEDNLFNSADNKVSFDETTEHKTIEKMKGHRRVEPQEIRSRQNGQKEDVLHAGDGVRSDVNNNLFMTAEQLDTRDDSFNNVYQLYSLWYINSYRRHLFFKSYMSDV